MTPSHPGGVGYASLGLIVSHPTTRFEVVSASRGQRVPGGVSLRRPRLGRAGDAEFLEGTAEIVATVFNARGGILDEFGWSAAPRDFHDHRDGNGRVRGFDTRHEDGPRAFILRIRRGASSVAFRLDRKGAPSNPLATILLEGEARRPGEAKNVVALDFERLPEKKPCGHIDEERSVRAHEGANDPRFDIVVTGDGYAEADIDRFVREASSVIGGLRVMQPFRRLDDKINYHILAAVSDHSGITDAETHPEGSRDTYFHSMTEFENPGFRTAIGTPFPELVKAAVGKFIRPWCEIDLVIVIANIDLYGGYAFRQHGTVFISREAKQDIDVLVHLAAHEGGHVIAKLADEYIAGSRYDPSDQRPNVATAEQLAANAVPWRKLARRAGALHRGGRLKLMHHYDSAWNLAAQEPKLPERDMRRIGAFWGCMYTKPAVDPRVAVVSALDDHRGASFYRPSARCIMRRIEDDFCAVCSEAVGQAIERKVKRRTAPQRRRHTATTLGYDPARAPLAARPARRD